MLLPVASSARARAVTSNADSVPIVLIRDASRTAFSLLRPADDAFRGPPTLSPREAVAEGVPAPQRPAWGHEYSEIERGRNSLPSAATIRFRSPNSEDELESRKVDESAD